MQIEGKVGVITGAASGIGRAAAAELQKQRIGALALVDLADAVHDVAAELGKDQSVVINLSGRGDKDVEEASRLLGDAIETARD